MPQPKKKRSHSKQGNVRHHWKGELPTLVKCKNCNELMVPHKACKACGFYDGKYVYSSSQESGN